MKQQFGRVESGVVTHYLGKKIQNELTDSISVNMQEKIVDDI